VALRTLGTAATTTLSAFVVGFNDLIPADLASINVAIKSDPPGHTASGNTPVLATGLVNQALTGTFRRQMNQAYIKNGVLIVPNRGQLVLRNGDFVCWDPTAGWPIVISGDAAATGSYVHT
jgi:hypothetical protein